MKDIIETLSESISICLDCPGHPQCVRDGMQECVFEKCEWESFCSKKVCRHCHPAGFAKLQPYCPIDERIDEFVPCNAVIPLHSYDDFDDYKDAVVPSSKTQIIDLVLSFPHEYPEKSILAFWNERIKEIRACAFAYMDFILLKRAFDGEEYIDFTDICRKLEITYSRESLKQYVHEEKLVELLLNSVQTRCEEGKPAEDEAKSTSIPRLKPPTVLNTSATLDEINTEEIWKIMAVRPSMKHLFIRQLKDKRRQYVKGAKKKDRDSFNTNDFIALGCCLFDRFAVDKQQGISNFLHRFLDALSIEHPSLKIPKEAEKILRRMGLNLDLYGILK